jgi:hypothetical protein
MALLPFWIAGEARPEAKTFQCSSRAYGIARANRRDDGSDVVRALYKGQTCLWIFRLSAAEFGASPPTACNWIGL